MSQAWHGGVIDPASFRDPAGQVIESAGRIFRAVGPDAWSDFQAVRSSGVLSRLIDTGRVVETREVEPRVLPGELPKTVLAGECRFLEHERIGFISYPYEWPYRLLKSAALHHLQLHLDLLDAGFTMSDASAYNVQFRGTRPVFIDVLSIRPYRKGEYWSGYRQFCEQFLNPLLMGAELGLPHQSWFRGSLDGIRTEEIARIMPLRSRLRWQAWLHVFLHSKYVLKTQSGEPGETAIPASRPMPRESLGWMLRSLRAWIAGMEEGGHGTRWKDYEHNHSYLDQGVEAKRSFISAYMRRRMPQVMLDIGCNSGGYAELVLACGATRVVGMDQDLGALDAAILRAESRSLDFLPLYMDVVNPSPDQGWAQRERGGLGRRLNADGLLALALLHHVVIGRNVPMDEVVAWLVGLAPSGVIEFVPKDDPMVRRMLMQRPDVFPGYGIESFRKALSRHARIIAEAVVPGSTRILVEYFRLDGRQT